MEDTQYTPEQEREGLKHILRAIDEDDLKKYRKQRDYFIIVCLLSTLVLAVYFGIAALLISVFVISYVHLIQLDDRISLLRRRQKSKIE